MNKTNHNINNRSVFSNFTKMSFSNRIIIWLAILPLSVFASHNRGGEITYVHLGGLTYEFTITTCTDLGSATGTDRPELYIDFDLGTNDAQRDTFQRVTQTPLLLNHQKNIYVGIHTFTSMGTHRITMEDPNRNAGILNVFPGGNSEDIVFALETYLIISPFLGTGGNNSVQFNDCPCPLIGCVNKNYCYNPMAYDPDGDSLSFDLVPPLGIGANPLIMPNYYVYPDIVGGGNISIDPIYGTVCWDNPSQGGEFNFTIKISEWRNGFLVGSVIRDVQLTIQTSCLNDPPEIDPIPDTCIKSGEELIVYVQGTDQNQDVIDLSMSGLPFNLNNNPANFSSVPSTGISNGIFQWQTTCNQIQQSAYQMIVELEDNGQPVFSDYESFSIKVRPPTVTGISVQPIGSSVIIKWDKAICSNAVGYNVYRKTGITSNDQNCCDSPDLISSGMTLIDQKATINDTVSIDNESLTFGLSYCYVVTAIYDYGLVESCPSDTACTQLKKEVPIITNITVKNTDNINGIDSIVWLPPPDLDTLQYPGPYLYEIYDDLDNLLTQLPTNNYLLNMDTNYLFTNISTTDTNRKYKLAIYYTHNNMDSLIGFSSEASSLHLNTLSSDNKIELSWNEFVPWENQYYFIYKSSSLNGAYTFLDSVNNTTYSDSGLVNNVDYCYYIESYGAYLDSTIRSPLINVSQKVCDKPFDFTPPCPPTISSITLDSIYECERDKNVLFWTNPNNYCSDDAVLYSIYFSPFIDSGFNLISSISDINDTSFTHQNFYNEISSLAGCYYITATDSLIYSNESIPSDTICFDNCPNFVLPNIFTPNSDNTNDFFQALVPIKYVNEITINIFNRWGQEVYKTNDPEFKWNGDNMENNQPCPTGVYYFSCSISTIRLSGIENIELSGFLNLVRSAKKQTQ